MWRGRSRPAPPKYWSHSSAADVGAAIVTFLKSYGLTGCDFDLEISTSGSNLRDLIQAIKNEDDSSTAWVGRRAGGLCPIRSN